MLIATLGALPARAEVDAAAAPSVADGGADALAAGPDAAPAPVLDGAVAPSVTDGGTDALAPVPDAAPAPVPGVAAAPPGETTVRARRRDIGQTTLSAADVREMPGAFGDPFRAIEALARRHAARQRPALLLHPRRAAQRQRLLHRRHPGSAPVPRRHRPGRDSPGRSIDRVDFFPGAAPASYGGVAGAIIAGQTREPAPALHGEANLRLFDAGALVEIAVRRRARQRARRRALRISGPDPGCDHRPASTLSYWDYQARATWRLADRDTLGMFAFGSHDYLATPSPSADPTARPIGAVRCRTSTGSTCATIMRSRGGHAADRADGRSRPPGRRAPTYVTDTLGGASPGGGRAGSAAPVRIRGGASLRARRLRLRRRTPTGPGDPAVPSTADPPPTNLTRRATRMSSGVLEPARRADAGRARRSVRIVARQRVRRCDRGADHGSRVRSAAVRARDDRAVGSRGSRPSASRTSIPRCASGAVPAPVADRARLPVGDRAAAARAASQPGHRDRAAGGRRRDRDGILLALVRAHRPDGDVRPDHAATTRRCPARCRPPPYACPSRTGHRPRVRRSSCSLRRPLSKRAERLALVHAVAVDPRRALHHAGGRRRRW